MEFNVSLLYSLCSYLFYIDFHLVSLPLSLSLLHLLPFPVYALVRPMQYKYHGTKLKSLLKISSSAGSHILSSNANAARKGTVDAVAASGGGISNPITRNSNSHQEKFDAREDNANTINRSSHHQSTRPLENDAAVRSNYANDSMYANIQDVTASSSSSGDHLIHHHQPHQLRDIEGNFDEDSRSEYRKEVGQNEMPLEVNAVVNN